MVDEEADVVDGIDVEVLVIVDETVEVTDVVDDGDEAIVVEFEAWEDPLRTSSPIKKYILNMMNC